MAILGVAGLVLIPFSVAWLVWPSEPTLEVLIWTSTEKQHVLELALARFNEDSDALVIDGRRYRVRARSIAVDSAEMRTLLVNRLNNGTEFPEWSGGAPTVVSPSTSSLLAQVNLATGQEVFQLKHLRPMVRTPVVIVTYKGMAECLGWPAEPVGWNDIIALAESPEGWASCPTARPEWGTKPIIVLEDPAVSATARSTLQILHVVAARKPAEKLTIEDLQNVEVLDMVNRFQNVASRPGAEALGFRSEMKHGPRFIHFAPMEEYNIPRFYEGQDTVGSSREVVAIYPEEGTVWHDNPFAIVNGQWVTKEQREAALVVEEYLRTEEVQNRFMEAGFRAGIYVRQSDVLTPSRGLDLREPREFLGRIPVEVALAIQRRWY